MFVPKPDQDKMHADVKAFVVCLQQNEKGAATDALRGLYGTIDKLLEQLEKELAKPKPKVKLHPAHQKATRVHQTRAKSSADQDK